MPAPPREAAAHFEDLGVQGQAARLGMWAFLGSELLLFAGLFCLYSAYRAMYREMFHAAGLHMSLVLGTVNTFVLLSSSLTVALAVWAVRADRPRLASLWLVATLVLALAFLALKGVEYAEHFREGIFPGVAHYRFAELPEAGAKIFFTLYYFMTGLHALHVIAGMLILVWCLWHTHRAHFDAAHHTGLELGAMYWHLVDLIWIFLWPLLYLVD
jgi:cytochrome c oxidase subunit 3